MCLALLTYGPIPLFLTLNPMTLNNPGSPMVIKADIAHISNGSVSSYNDATL